MLISNVEIANFRALKEVSIPMKQFSVLLGENDTGKTSFLYALESFFAAKKLNNPKDWYQKNTSPSIRITITFSEVSGIAELQDITRTDGTVVINRNFILNKTPETKAILEDQSAVNIDKAILDRWFSSNIFHFIPVHRDLSVQFSMNKTAMLGKLLRAKMRQAIDESAAESPISELTNILEESLREPRELMEHFLKEQLSNESLHLGFNNLEIDPTEGVKFDVTLSDDKVDDVLIADRGAGTQNNLIIALFRILAESNLAGQFIFAMEEPENSLHPKAQRQLLRVIHEISESTQVIVTTHSPVFIDRSSFESNILLTRTTHGNTVAKPFASDDLSSVRTDLGIRASDALLKGGGNCAILVEGKTEEEGFPIFMEMLDMSEFELGVAIINMGGSDFQKAKSIVKLLQGYDIPCVVVLDKDAEESATDLIRMQDNSLKNLKHVFCLKKGTIEDYYPTEIVAEVINTYLSPRQKVTSEELDQNWSGKQRLDGYSRIMHEHGAGKSLEYLKTRLGLHGSKILMDKEYSLDQEIQDILFKVQEIASNAH